MGTTSFKKMGTSWDREPKFKKYRERTRHRFSLISGSGNGGGERQGKSVGRIVGGVIFWLGPAIFGLVSLYVENQSKSLFRTYQSWISLCLFLLTGVRQLKHL